MTDHFTVRGALDRYIDANQSIREPDGKWHPSGLFSCERQAVYAVRGIEPTNERDPRSKRILYTGTTFHGIVQSAARLDPHVATAYTEVLCDVPDLNILGSADQLLRFHDGTWELQEYKTISPKGMEYALPKPEHVEQVRTYMFVLRWYGSTAEGRVLPPLRDALTRARVSYVSRDDMRVEEFIIEADPEWEAAFEERIDRLERYREDGTALPPRLPDEVKRGRVKRAWLCDYCAYATRCWTSDPEGVEL